MKTSKEMQLKILDRMKENVKRDLPLFDGLYRVVDGSEFILNGLWDNSFKKVEHGIYPERISVNGVYIPKPLSREQLEEVGCCLVYYPVSIKPLFDTCYSDDSFANYFDGMLCYKTEEEAIEASKALFEIKQ